MIGQEGSSRAWVLLALGDARQYAGNVGYSDDFASVYHYDSFVPNHLQVRVGDLVVLRDRRSVLGSAVVEEIDASPSEKLRLSCPVCDTTAIKERQTLEPRFRCSRGHAFPEPKGQMVTCVAYAAAFGSTWVPARDVIRAEVLRAAETQSSDQLSIRAIDPSRLSPATREVLGLSQVARGGYSAALASDAARPDQATAASPYDISGLDTRAEILRTIRARQGQAPFRAALRNRYGDACMITGCTAMDVVEAAHISPYRGAADHHPDNGLLLRADLHTLFDLDLIAFDPATLVVHVHPKVLGRGYKDTDGRVLQVGTRGRPSERLHWWTRAD